MSVAKCIEVIGEGDSMEDAVKKAVAHAAKTVKNIRGVYVENIQALVEDGSVTRFRVNAKITFVVNE